MDIEFSGGMGWTCCGETGASGGGPAGAGCTAKYIFLGPSMPCFPVDSCAATKILNLYHKTEVIATDQAPLNLQPLSSSNAKKNLEARTG